MSDPQQLQMPDFDPRQMQAMMALATASMGGMGGMGNPSPDVGLGGMGGGGVDPTQQVAAMQAYMQVAATMQYLQAANLQNPAGGIPGIPGMPPMSFPGMPQYNPLALGAPPEAAITVAVEGMKFQYQLTEDDLLKVFSRYGAVKSITVDESAGSSASITFQHTQDAQSAMNDLNGKVLNGLEGTLVIDWANPGPAASPYQPMPFPGIGFGNYSGNDASPWSPGSGQLQGGGQGDGDGGKGGVHNRGVRKYTCRFLIGIENDEEFQVARRIIGAKGANMKRIVKQTEAKLRLRGKGSGYFEGAGQKESSEPLQLCVSCTGSEGYKSAVRQVEDLLKRIYEEYKGFCRENAKPIPDLQISLSENQLVYSSRAPGGGGNSPGGGGGGGGGGGDSPGGGLDGDGAKRERRSRRNRARGGGPGAPSNGGASSPGGSKAPGGGEVERGEPGPNAPPVDEIEKHIEMRNEARRACNFAEADRLRESLHQRGVALMDEPGGRGRGSEVTTWRYWRD